MRTTAVIVVLVLLAGLFAVCHVMAAPSSPATAPSIAPGANCTVQFRRDALGCAANLPVSPTADNINGAEVSVRGKLVKIDAEWVVLAREHNQFWIPRQNVLLLQIDKQ